MTRGLGAGLPRGGPALLARRGIVEGDWLSLETEADVYRLGVDRVLEVFGGHVCPLSVESRRAFRASLDASRAGFAVPRTRA